MQQIPEPVLFKETEICRIGFYGNLPPLPCNETKSTLIRIATAQGAQAGQICFLQAAGTPDSPGYKQVVEPVFDLNGTVYGDGVILKDSGDAVVMATADCASFVPEYPAGNMIGVAHCGRPALLPPSTDHPHMHMVGQICSELCPSTHMDEIASYAFGAISAEYFLHNDENGQHLVAPFKEIGGAKFFAGDPKQGALDLRKIMKSYFLGQSLDPSKQEIDITCTYRSPLLASHRAGDKNRNYTVVVKK